MAAGRIKWDNSGDKYFETGSKNAVLYPMASDGTYEDGVAWNGFTGFSENPTGAESNKMYADDILYADLKSAEEFEGSITAYTYPDEFAECDGSIAAVPGVYVGMQKRKKFGLCYRTTIGNDVDSEVGYKLHLIYGASASPSEKSYTTINDSPEGMEFSWDITTIPEDVSDHNNQSFKKTAIITIDSRKFTGTNASKLDDLKDILYGKDAAGGSEAVAPRLPLPDEVISTLA